MADHEPPIPAGQLDDGPRSGRDRPRSQVSPAPSVPGSRDVWRASASFGLLIGALLLLVVGAGVVVLATRVPSTDGGQRVAWIAAVVALTALTIGIAVVLRALPTMRYRFTADALIVEWFGQQRFVPLAEITDVTFEPTVPLTLPRWEPFWPGYYVATVRTPSGTWRSWATQQPHRRVRIQTENGIVAISPERPVRFVTELERRRRAAGLITANREPVPENVLMSTLADRSHVQSPPLLPQSGVPRRSASEQPEPQPSRRRPSLSGEARRPGDSARPARGSIVDRARTYLDLFRDQLLGDQVASALVAAGVVLPVLMAAYLYSQYEGLPAQIPIQWDASGEVAELTTPGGLWRFPQIAIIILVVNTALATLVIGIDRYLARLVLAGIPLAQVILFIALVRAIS